jgi:hypothetical protein
MDQREPVQIEGYTPDEILGFSDGQITTFVFCDEPIVFQMGSATLLGEFKRAPDRLIIELAQIDGGGEGVLPTLWMLVQRYAQTANVESVEWIVHAINCARPNLKLRRVLGKLGFKIEDIPGVGEAYHRIHPGGASSRSSAVLRKGTRQVG